MPSTQQVVELAFEVWILILKSLLNANYSYAMAICRILVCKLWYVAVLKEIHPENMQSVFKPKSYK